MTARIVTVIGGGTGSFHVLSGLRMQPDLSIRSVVSMMDSGGDSGRLRDEFGVLPPGDIRRCLIALSEESSLLRNLFTFRFEEPPLEGRSFGNLLFLALTRTLGSEQHAVEAIGSILKIRGRVVPVTWDHAHLFARLENGEVIEGEANINVPQHDANVPIEHVFLSPCARANREAIGAIAESDFIVIAPGDLYTSTLPNLLVQDIPEALQCTRARVIYVLNLMTRYGETSGYSAARHVEELIRYGGRAPDVVLAHEGEIPEALALRYEKEAAHPVALDTQALYDLGVELVQTADIACASSLVRHDPARTGAALSAIFEMHASARPSRR